MKAKKTLQFVIKYDDGFYYAESLDVAVVTQGETLDETISNLRDAVSLHLEGEDLSVMGIVPGPAIIVTYETEAAGVA